MPSPSVGTILPFPCGTLRLDAPPWSVNRLGRSFQNLLEFLAELHALRVDPNLHQQGMDTKTPAGKARFQMCGAFVEFERSIIMEPINAGSARTKSNGKRLGRPRVDESVEQAIRQALSQGDRGIRQIAGEMGVGVSVGQRIRNDFRSRVQ